MYLISNNTLAHVINLSNVHPSFYKLQISTNTFATNYDIFLLLNIPFFLSPFKWYVNISGIHLY